MQFVDGISHDEVVAPSSLGRIVVVARSRKPERHSTAHCELIKNSRAAAG